MGPASDLSHRITVPSDFESEGIEGASVFAHNNISCEVDWSPLKLDRIIIPSLERYPLLDIGFYQGSPQQPDLQSAFS